MDTKNAVITRAWLAVLTVGLVGCAKTDAERHYELAGQIVDIRGTQQELVIAHEDIPGYMQAMTMPFRVADSSLLTGLQPGDLVRGDLVVSAEDGFIEALEKTGHRALAPVAAPVPAAIAYLIEGDSVPEQTFLDHDGEPLTLFDGGRAEVLTFIYTRCPFPTFCPLIDRQFQALHTELEGTPGLDGRVRLLSITIDPEHDSTTVLGAHAALLGATNSTWRFARVVEDAPGTFAAKFGVVANTASGDEATLVHNLVTVVIAPDRTIAAIYRGNQWTVSQLVAALRNTLE